MYTAQLPNGQPFAIRYPRGKGVLENWKLPFEKINIGKGNIMCEGEEIAIISIGHIGNMITEITQEFQSNNIRIGHYDIRFLKPLDEKLLHHFIQTY